mmetsp:Transcript_27403/g.39239  ORF Transcript_27403/g.39239 Transcript_27403/m.39239 type:complete len:230 (-) Transcript_27403:1003-1692(-)
MYVFKESRAVGRGGNLLSEDNIPSFVVCTTIDDDAAAACLSAASFAARISLRLCPPSTSNRCLRTLISRLASEGTNFRFLVPSSSSSCDFVCAVEAVVDSVTPPLALVIHAGKFDTPRCPESVTSTVVAVAELSVDCCCCCSSCCRFSSSRFLLSLRPSSINCRTFFDIRSVIISTRLRRLVTSRVSNLRLNSNTAFTTSGALSGSASSSYAPPPAAAAILSLSNLSPP